MQAFFSLPQVQLFPSIIAIMISLFGPLSRIISDLYCNQNISASRALKSKSIGTKLIHAQLGIFPSSSMNSSSSFWFH